MISYNRPAPVFAREEEGGKVSHAERNTRDELYIYQSILGGSDDC